MTSSVNTSALMESSDMKATLLAAIARIESVPAGRTLIDCISNEDWLDDSVADWKIEAGLEVVSGKSAEELDSADAKGMQVA